jgi:hypothetical protein
VLQGEVDPRPAGRLRYLTLAEAVTGLDSVTLEGIAAGEIDEEAAETWIRERIEPTA